MTESEGPPPAGLAATYVETIDALGGDAEKLEQLYHAALESGEQATFREAIEARYAGMPGNPLYAAWFYRLRYAAAQAKGYAIAWSWAIPLAALNGLLFWWLSDDQRFMIRIQGARPETSYQIWPALFLLAAPLSAAFVMAYLTLVGRKRWRLALLIGIPVILAGAYALLTYPQAGPRPYQEQYVTLMAMHLPLLAWAGVGAFCIAGHRDPASRFAFLIKSLELFIMGGLFVIAGGLFTGITIGLFAALDVDLPPVVQRLFLAGGGGLIPVIATAVIYNPTVPPAGQAFEEGLSKLVAIVMRILLPLSLLVLLVYIGFIPFNFSEPFENRDVLIIYNGMLFAVVALLVGGTPVKVADLSPNLARWLRRGIIAVATLALIVSLYALAAILYRTILDRLTPNRLAFIGWNVVNVALLILLLALQVRSGAGSWLYNLHRAYSAATVAYACWAAAMILALPWLFGLDQAEIEALPPVVQDIVYDYADPVLLKCRPSTHIYLLEDGKKRWIDSIATFNDRGYVWSDVHFVSCDSLRSVPDGVSIPADAGPPPQP